MATKKQIAPARKYSLDDLIAEGVRYTPEVTNTESEPAPATPRGTMRAVGDTAVQFGKGALTGVRMVSDVFGADNAVSGGLRSADEALNGLLSATAKQDQAQVQAIMQEAEGKGWMEQIGLGLKAAGVAPGALMAQAAGTALPTLAASALTGGAAPAAALARLGVAGAVGGVQGMGSVKGAIYDNTKQELLKAGATPEEAEARAVDQQSYGGDSAGQIALGGVGGFVAGGTGAERIMAGLRGGVSKAAPGLASRMAAGGITEAVPEFAQGGQEKYATNSALNNEGFKVDPMSGVVANATMEGVAGAGMGAALGIPRPAVTPQQAAADVIRETEMVAGSGTLARAANAGTEAKARAVESMPSNFSATPTATMGAAVTADAGNGFNLDNLPNGAGAPANIIDQADLDALVETEQRDLQVMQAQADMELQKQAEIDAAFAAKPELDATTAAVEQAATIDAPNAMQAAFNKLADKTIGPDPEPAAVIPKEPRIVARTSDMVPIPLELAELQVDMAGGEVARVQNANGKFGYVVVPKPAAPIKPAKVTASTVKTAPGTVDGDILNKLGKPFTNLFAANTEAAKQGAGFEPMKLRDNAFVVRRVEAKEAPVSPVEPIAPVAPPTITPEPVNKADLPNDLKPDATPEQVDAAMEAEYQRSIKEAIQVRLGRVKPAETNAKKTPFKSFLREYGIAPAHTSDIAGSNRMRANNVLPATFRANGLGLDALAERAIERGFMTEADRGDQGKLIAMIQSEISGEQQISSEFATEDAAAQTERVQRREIEGMADGLGLPYDADISTDRLASMVSRINDRLKDEPRGTTKAQRILAQAKETVARIERKRAKYEANMAVFAASAISEQDAALDVQLDEDGNPVIVRIEDIKAVEAWLEENQQWDNGYGTDTRANQDSGQTGAPVTEATQERDRNSEAQRSEPQPGSTEAQAGEPEGLTAPTRADVLAQQEAVEQAEKAKAKADKDAEAKAKADGIAKEIAARQEASADNFQLGQSAEDSLAGQGSVFDEPTAPISKTGTTAAPVNPPASDAEVISRTVERFDRLGVKGVERKKSVIETLASQWGMTSDEVADMPEVQSALRKSPAKASKTAATERFVQGVMQQGLDAVAAERGEANPVQPAAESKPAKIEDSGEVLEGARKLYAKNYAAKLEEGAGMDAAAVPLSKSWPEPDYQRLIDEGADPWAVAMARAMRDEVPTKPSSSWKLKGWVQKVEALRDMTAKVMSGEMTKEKFKTTGGQFNLADWFNKIDLYEAVGHANSLKGLTFGRHEYGMYAGQTFNPAKVLWTINMPSKSASATWSNGNWGNDLAVADTKAEAIEKFKAWSAAQVEAPPVAAKATSFDIYSYRSKPNVFIVGKRISSAKSVDLKEFPTAKEARAYVAANQAELERLLAEAKFEPSERGESNAPRVGADHRNGADVTTDQFRDTFGFRGEQFGASMPQGERQANMNQAYDALMDLAGVIGIPPKALSLNGELGLAFGARGVGGKNPAAAHYERDTTGAVTPNRVVINLTRKNGAGSLAHEWFHAVDNYFARMRGEKAGMLTESYANRGEGVRPEMVTAFKQLVTTIQLSGVKERSKQLDKKRVKDYWSTGLEMAARSFESYVIAKLQDKNGANDYLANIVPEELYAMQGSYPYPVMGEMPAIRAAFDNFFDVVQTKETAQGVAMFSRSTSDTTGQNKAQVTAIVSAIAERWGNAPKIVIADNMADPLIPQAVRDYDQTQKSQGATGEPEGFVYKGKVYLVADQLATPTDVMRVLFHESLGHVGLRGVFGDKLKPILQQLAGLRRADVSAKADQYGLDMTVEADRLQAAEEVLAELAQSKPELGYVKRAIAVIRSWLREHVPGFTGMKMSDAELVQNFILPARRFIESRGGTGAFTAAVENQQNQSQGQQVSAQAATESVATAAPEIGTSAKNAADAAPDVLFSRSPIGQAVQSTQDALKNATVTDLLKQFGNRLSDFRGLGLQALGRRQLVDIYGKDLPAMVAYSDMVAQMDADKNESGAEADGLATDWGKLTDERQLAELMHDATLAQIDPDKPMVDGDDANQYEALKDGFDILSLDAKAAFRKARDMYSTHNEKVRQAIQERIMRSDLSSAKKAALLERMDGEFFQKVKGVYFPLARFGQYVTVVKDAGGNVVSANRSETMNEAVATRKVLQKQFPLSGGFRVGKVLKDREFNAARDGVGRGFMADLFETLEKTGAGDELMDSISQLYLSALPDLSWAKHGIHRKGTPGFSQDARRAFAQNMFHGARYLAKLRYADQLQSGLDAMQEHIAKQSENEAYDSVKAQQVVDEMVKRHESMMNPDSNPLSTALTSLGFVFHLGLSPASALVNLSQTALVAYPVMGAKWGFGKASAALLVASKQAASNKNDISSTLNEDERRAYDEAVRRGVIDVTMAHDLAGIAQGEDAKVSSALKPVVKYASFLFHHAEKFNRQVTFVAAYRLAREAGTAHDKSFDEAVKATYDGHFDYSASNRPRLMQGNVARVVFLFKQYSQNMIYTLTRNAQQAIKAETPEGRAEARKALSGLLVSHAMAAGVFGLPVVGMLFSAASLIGGDDDEPWDAKVALQNMLADSMGPKAAEVFAHGLSRLTPWDISGRVGLDKLLLPDVQEGLEGTRAAESWLAQAVGPVAGIGINMAKGLSEMGKGEYQRGLESMLPTALRGPVKAWRYSTEGNVDKSGVAINDEVSTAGVWGQALGFSPSETRLAQEGKSAIYSADKAIQTRRSNLVRQFSLASMAKDVEGQADARKAIVGFNKKNPKAAISQTNLVSSIKARQKRINQARMGVYLPGKRQDAMEAGRFAEVE